MKNTVLLIENDKDTVAKAAAALEGAGYSIVGADTAKEGTDKAIELVPVLIMINLATPGANGLELCKSLHNTEALSDVPIVLLTLREGKFEPVYTKLYGIVSFLKKPFQNDELLALAQEHAPVEAPEAEVEESVEDDSTMEMGEDSVEEGFGTMEMDSAMDSGDDEGVFSIDESEQSLDDLQSSFQEQLEEDSDMSADMSGDMSDDTEDDFEGTQQFTLDDTEPTESGDSAAATAEDDAGGDWGEMESGDSDAATAEDDAGGDWGEMDSGDSAAATAEDDAGGDWGEMDSGDSAAATAEDDAGGDWGEMDSGDADATAQDDDDMDADSTLKMDLAKSGWDAMDVDDSEDTKQMDSTEEVSDADSGFDAGDTASVSPDEDEFGGMGGDMEDEFGSDDTMQMDAPESAGETEGPMSDDTPTFDDEPMGDDESFMDNSIAGDDDLPQMDMEDEDYSELFADSDEAQEDTGKGKKKKKKKTAKTGGKSHLKRILVLVLLLLVLGGGGFAAYTFFLAEEPVTVVTVTMPTASRPATVNPDMDEEPPADLLKELEEEDVKMEETKAAAPAPKKKPAQKPKASTPKPRKKPAPAATVAAMASGAYYVQFGVFGVKANAERMASNLERTGLKPLIQPRSSGGKTVNYVLLDEPFGSWAKASRKASELKRLTGFNTAVYKIK